VIDHESKVLDASQRSQLKHLAKFTETSIDTHRTRQKEIIVNLEDHSFEEVYLISADTQRIFLPVVPPEKYPPPWRAFRGNAFFRFMAKFR